MKSEDYCIILDYMPTGKSSAIKTEPIAQAIGKEFFTLLELVPKPGANLQVGEEVYVGKEEREKIQLIKGRIKYKDLTSNSMSELQEIVEKMVEENKEKYINFFNISRPISLKRHQIELLPGMGKKHVNEILDERAKGNFKDFEEITKRVKSVPDPKRAIIKRIMEEIEGLEDKFYLFVRPPPIERQFHRKRY
jgi:putative nucleotide binding protein